jgi:hypothetical protein
MQDPGSGISNAIAACEIKEQSFLWIQKDAA